jgi:hypothetical protein
MEKALATTPAVAQAAGVTPAPVPYARVGEEPVSYAGPHRLDLPDRARVVLFGRSAAEVAGSTAVKDAIAAAGWEIVPVASDQNWGAASTQLVHALMDEHALAIVALDRDAAHLAEQLALKAFVPVIALSDDRALTSTNVPWIFRVPASTAPGTAMQMLAAAEARSGPNPERLRDLLASGEMFSGVAFLSTGEPKAH